MVYAISEPPVRNWILASGLVHLSLFAFFVLGPKIPFSVEKPQLTEVTFLPVRSLAVPRDRASIQSQPDVVKTRPHDVESGILPKPDSIAKMNAPSESATVAETFDSPEILSTYEMEVASKLNALKRYPEMARRMRQQGRVMVRFKLSRDGQVIAREIVAPSAHASLNEAARMLLEQIREFKPFPSETRVTSWVFTVPIEYRL